MDTDSEGSSHAEKKDKLRREFLTSCREDAMARQAGFTGLAAWIGDFEFSVRSLEQFHKCCSAAEKLEREAVFLTFGFVSARSQATLGMLPRQSLAQSQKSSLRRATSFLS
ncbi:MAG: hypothetical protein JWR19_768, partial [Pedosphaera sp.]|nr:hypothetical protein [Pedosphaera sp.]